MLKTDLTLTNAMESKTLQRRNDFLKAVEEYGKENNEGEKVSLWAHLRQFLRSPLVNLYYNLVPNLVNTLEVIRKTYETNTVLVSLIEALQKSVSTRAPQLESGKLFLRLQEALLEAIHEENMLLDMKAVRTLMEQWWTLGWQYFVDSREYSLSTQYILEDLLGLRITLEKGMYESHWQRRITTFLRKRYQEEEYYLDVIEKLDETEHELERLYENMDTVVQFSSLVMLTFWRLEHGKFVKISETRDWTLVYGNLREDYPVFLDLHHHGYLERPVRINVYYIDFEASPESYATHLELIVRSNQVPITFGAVFAKNKAFNDLSFMKHR